MFGKDKRKNGRGSSGLNAEDIVQGMRPFKGESHDAFISRAADAVIQLESGAHGGTKPDAASIAAAEARVRIILKNGEDTADRKD